ncbi:class I SAM-dependent methyltransferase [Marinobacterium lutimaris]|uniref:class I SAM-dependent methyltransferase n=1 Tax=Marinobacterium lutimaris TaxID=568106 RepID=UPI000CDE9884|nr:class I SAM-dependent methyltransferase [Marinobacterium lutimaris]
MNKADVSIKSWPEENLEYVKCCPVCGNKKSTLLFNDLVDNTFFVAPGSWKLYQCNSCKSGYLNPRPDKASIHKAYGEYYTHEILSEQQTHFDKLSFGRKILRMLANGYYNYHHGTARKPSIRLGAWLLLCYPKFRRSANARYRYLKKPKTGQRLLDVGCGNGDFLAIASEAGWIVKGVEPDPKALAVAKERGFYVVQGGLEEIAYSGEIFDVITINHVIEHVHNPSDFVHLAYSCLKPGGYLYIETPNIESKGMQFFGKSWRGIEAPRHLVLFSKKGIENVIINSCFKKAIFRSRVDVRKGMALQSSRIEKCEYDSISNKIFLRFILFFHWPRKKNCEEFLTVVAVK